MVPCRVVSAAFGSKGTGSRKRVLIPGTATLNWEVGSLGAVPDSDWVDGAAAAEESPGGGRSVHTNLWFLPYQPSNMGKVLNEKGTIPNELDLPWEAKT